MKERTCQHCGCAFIQKYCTNPQQRKNGGQMFCSRACRNKARILTFSKTCSACGSTFYRKTGEKGTAYRSRKSCSDKCACILKGLHAIKQNNCICNQCSKAFLAPKNELEKGWGKFCSRDCYNDYQRSKAPKDNCKVCGTEFRVLKTNKRKYCSFHCRLKALNAQVPCTCKTCGKQFTYYRSMKTRYYCSKECMTKDYRGDKVYLWKGGKSREPYPISFDNQIKRQIRERDGYHCQLCGLSVEDCIRDLNVHHIDYDKNNLDLSNLIALCGYCHSRTNFKRAYWPILLKGVLRLRTIE